MPGERSGPELHEDLALAVARGVPLVRWAKQNGIPERTARDWASKPEFKASVAGFRREIVSRTVGKLVAHTTAAAAEIAKLMRHATDDRTRLAAARTILEQSVALTTHHDLEQRLDELEGRVHGKS